MDVWSCGLTVLDCILPQPLLQARFAQAPAAFFEWLAQRGEISLPDEVRLFDAPLADFLETEVLRCDPADRCSVLEVMQGLEAL